MKLRKYGQPRKKVKRREERKRIHPHHLASRRPLLNGKLSSLMIIQESPSLVVRVSQTQAAKRNLRNSSTRPFTSPSRTILLVDLCGRTLSKSEEVC
jgi:hypothetical protein